MNMRDGSNGFDITCSIEDFDCVKKNYGEVGRRTTYFLVTGNEGKEESCKEREGWADLEMYSPPLSCHLSLYGRRRLLYSISSPSM